MGRTRSRVRFKRPNFKHVFWDSGMYYVRCSNAWPNVLDYPKHPSEEQA